MRRIIQVIAIVLVMAMLLGGCSFSEFGRQVGNLLERQRYHNNLYVYPYEDMVYERPDMDAIQEALDQVCSNATAGEDLNLVLDGIYAFYDVYDSFYTNYYLADLRYKGDMTDDYWAEESNFCLENYPQVDAWLEELYHTLAESPLREELEAEKYFGEGYFDSYDGENLWDEEFTKLMEKEAKLQNEYYALSGEAMATESYSEEYFEEYGTEMARILVEMVKLRQQIAKAAGYDNYIDFAYDFY